MSERIFEKIRVTPLLRTFTTAAASAIHKVKWTDEDRMLFVCSIGGASAASSGVLSSVVCDTTFTLLEATAATANGSAITGATMVIGTSTAHQVRSAVGLLIRNTSGLTTVQTLEINGVSILTTATDASGELTSTRVAAAINKAGIPHIVAYPNYTDTGLTAVFPSDGLGTGISATSTGGDYQLMFTQVVGAIELNPETLSTNTPKFIGISLTTINGATCIRTVDVLRIPRTRPAFAGKTVATT